MIRRLATAHENPSEREGTTSVVPRRVVRAQGALASEGLTLDPQRLKPLVTFRFFGTTEVVPSRRNQSSKGIFSGERTQRTEPQPSGSGHAFSHRFCSAVRLSAR